MTTLITLPSGLQYRDEVIGTGTEAGKGSSFVKVHYTGWLKNPDGTPGKKFDCSRERNQPFTFPIGVSYVIPGWDHGVKGMKVGGRRTLYIPPRLAYGPAGFGNVIPPNADLIFDIELLSA